jgi:pimeloyl-ACP methyl ester carboxylesterase
MNEVRLPQGTIRYRDLGAGEPIVLVHGLLTNGELWREVAPRLASDFRVIAPDWPLGSHELPLETDADRTPPGLSRLIADFLAALELENVTLVGNDTGGALCQLVAAHHPQRAAKSAARSPRSCAGSRAATRSRPRHASASSPSPS